MPRARRNRRVTGSRTSRALAGLEESRSIASTSSQVDDTLPTENEIRSTSTTDESQYEDALSEASSNSNEGPNDDWVVNANEIVNDNNDIDIDIKTVYDNDNNGNDINFINNDINVNNNNDINDNNNNNIDNDFVNNVNEINNVNVNNNEPIPPPPNLPNVNQNIKDITLQDIRDSIISSNTQKVYGGDIIHLLVWMLGNKREWLTEYGIEQLTPAYQPLVGESRKHFRKRKTDIIKDLVRHAYHHPIVNIDIVQPEEYMVYILSLCTTTNPPSYLSNSAYNNKRSSLSHLFRQHNRRGFSENFRIEIGNLLRGFKREIAQQRQHPPRRRRRNADDDDYDDDDNVGVGTPSNRKEGKEPMSIELYRAVCEWFLKLIDKMSIKKLLSQQLKNDFAT
jgi:hypothetical protein